MSNDTQQPEGIWVSSGVSASTGQGFVHYRWNTQECQFTPEEARQHALVLLAGANAAESDAAVLSFLGKQLGLPRDKAAAIVRELRHYRQTEGYTSSEDLDVQ